MRATPKFTSALSRKFRQAGGVGVQTCELPSMIKARALLDLTEFGL
jgi:hypothetical protein